MNQATSVVKLKLSPDDRVNACLNDQSSKCNSLYNKLLEEANRLREKVRSSQDEESAKVLYSRRGLRDLVPLMKEKHPFLRSVHSAPLKNTAFRLIGAIKKSRKEGAGWPKFRAQKKHWFSLLYDEPYKGYKVGNGVLEIALGLGMDRKRKSLKIPISSISVLKNKHVRNLRIIKENCKYYAVFTVFTTVPKTRPINKIIALDPNHKNLAYGVDSDLNALEIKPPTWLKISDKRIDELKSRSSQCIKTSRRYKKLSKTLNHAQTKRREQTKGFCYRIANQLFKTYDLVAIGDYTPNRVGITTGMRRAMNNQSLIGRFKEVLSWVAVKSGKSYEEFVEKGTTRTCHACSFVVKEGIAPNMRYWDCPSCSAVHIRDENAACNGLRRVLKKSKADALQVPGSGHVSVKKRWAWRVLSSGEVIRCGGKAVDFHTSKKLNLGHGSPRPRFTYV